MSHRTQQELTRAERVRMRKTAQGNSQTREARKRVHHYAAEATPVTVRGGLGTPVLQRTRSKPRRKISIPLDQRGTEMQLPAIPILHPGWRILSAFLVAAFSVLVYLAYNTPALRVTAPEINGLKFIPVGDILRSIDILDRPIFAIDTEMLAAELEQDFPDLTNTTVQVKLPAKVIINTSETQPAAIWQLEYRSVWCDETGKVIPQRGGGRDVLTIEIEGNLPMQGSKNELQTELEKDTKNRQEQDSGEPQYVDQMLLKTALKLGEYAPAGTILTYSTWEGFGWYDTNGWKVVFGSELGDLDQKLLVYQAIVSQLEKEGFQPGMINVEYVHAPFYRMEH